jgi:spore germination cell wall hydrolase CwlJ-like protein
LFTVRGVAVAGAAACAALLFTSPSVIAGLSPDAAARAVATVDTVLSDQQRAAATSRESPIDAQVLPIISGDDAGQRAKVLLRGAATAAGSTHQYPWLNNPVPQGADSEAEITCLATAIYFEARGEPERGQAAVAQVVLNRVRDPAYPNTICGVVYQGKDRYKRCQFSFACDGKSDSITNQSKLARVKTVARQVLGQERLNDRTCSAYPTEIGASTHYHAEYVRPYWVRSMVKVATIGGHIFYAKPAPTRPS